MRKRIQLLAASIAVLSFGLPAEAGVLDPSSSFMEIRIGSWDPIIIPSGSSGATLASDGTITVSASIWATTGVNIGTEFLVDATDFDSLLVTVANGAGTYTPGFTAAMATLGPGTLVGGGYAALIGQAVVLGGPTGIQVDLGVVGGGGRNVDLPIGVSGIAWGTNSVQITGIGSNIIEITNGARSGIQGIAFTLAPTSNENTIDFPAPDDGHSHRHKLAVHSAYITGSRNTSGGVGTVTLITPMRILGFSPPGNFLFVLPGVARQVMTFVPEPGTLLLIGGAGLVLLGGRKWRERDER